MSHRSSRQPSPGELSASRRFEGAAGRTRGLFVTGTDTGAGKTVLASAIAATLANRGERVAVFKPVVTGLEASDNPLPDHELLLSSARSGQAPNDVAPYRFRPSLSPHLAAELAGVRIEPAVLLQAARRAAARADVLIVEGVGGLLVPLTPRYLVRDFAVDLGLPLVIAARPGLGTINHSLLTIEAARRARLRTAAVVLTPWPEEPTEMERSNRDTIASLGEIEVATLGPLYLGPPVNAVGVLPVDWWLDSSPDRRPAVAAAA
jgi:dethiobiotin synthetase